MAKDGIEFEGLTEFQLDLLEVAQDKMPREVRRAMMKIGNRAAVHVRRVARTKVQKKTGTYHKRFKRGKVFKDAEGKWVTRVYNSSSHAHLIEHGHRQVTKDGREIGFTPGKHVMEEGIQRFDDSGEYAERISDWLDEMLDSKGL